MTRDEAIKALTIQLEYWEQLKEKNVLTDHEGNNVVDILKMAIEALQKQEHDGCEGCKYTHKDQYEMPCLMCKQSKKDLWERREP